MQRLEFHEALDIDFWKGRQGAGPRLRLLRFRPFVSLFIITIASSQNYTVHLG